MPHSVGKAVAPQQKTARQRMRSTGGFGSSTKLPAVPGIGQLPLDQATALAGFQLSSPGNVGKKKRRSATPEAQADYERSRDFTAMYLPALEHYQSLGDYDYEMVDRLRISQVKASMGCDDQWEWLSQSSPDLHANSTSVRQDSRMPSLGQVSTASGGDPDSPSGLKNSSSLPSLSITSPQSKGLDSVEGSRSPSKVRFGDMAGIEVEEEGSSLERKTVQGSKYKEAVGNECFLVGKNEFRKTVNTEMNFVGRMPDLCQLSMQWGIPFDDLKASRELFLEFAVCESNDPNDALRNGRMTDEAFTEVLCKMWGTAAVEDLPEDLLQEAFQIVDKNRNGNIDFWEFSVWHNTTAFYESLVLTEKERNQREVGKQLGISPGDIDRYAKMYHQFDFDGNGHITYPEFKELLHMCMKAPPGLSIPEQRILHFWRAADVDGNGYLCFEEFVVFYAKNFDAESEDPMVSFYENLRKTASTDTMRHSWDT